MNNIIIVKLDSTYAEVYSGIWQWNYGQILRIQGGNLPKVVEVHFSLQDKGGDSITRIGTTIDGATDVPIPDSFLENGGRAQDYKIYAFIYLEDGTAGNTEYKIEMSVKSRPKPEVPGTPEEPELFRETVKAVNAAADRAEQAEQNAKASATEAGKYAASASESAVAAEKTKEDALKEVGEKKQEAIEAIHKKEETSVGKIINHTDNEIQRIQNQTADSKAGLEQTIKNAGVSKEELEHSIETAGTSKTALNKSTELAGTAKTELDTSTQKAGEAKTALDGSARTAGEMQETLSVTVKQAGALDTSLGEKIETGTQLKTELTASGEKAVQDIQTAGSEQLGKMQAVAEEFTDDREQIATNKEDIGSLKEEISDSLGEFRYHGKFVSEKKYSTIETSIAPKKGDLIFFRADENNSTLFIHANLFLYYTDNDYDQVIISKVGDYKFVVAQKDYIKTRINNELSQADATEPTWSATVMSSGEHSLTGSLTLFYSLLDSGIELRKNDIENLKTDFISKHSKRFVVSKSKNNTMLDFAVGANDKGLIFVSETNATKFTAYDLYGHKPDDTFELLESNISVVGSIHTYDNNNRYDYLRIIFKCSAPSTSDEYVCAVVTTDTEYTAFGFITRLLGDVDNLKETSATQEQIADLDSRMLKSKEDIDDCLKVKYTELKQDNLINVDNLIVGVCDSDGSFKDDNRYRRTDYEFVKPNTTYSSWRMIWRNALGIVRIAFFDKNKKFISGGRDIGNIFTTPSDAYYVILTYVANENMTEERMPMVCEGNNVPEVYLPYKNEYIKKVVEYVKKEDLKPHAYMPDVIYCALGRTIDIYNNQVCIDADKFHLCWTCDIGFGEGRKFTVTPTKIGNHNLKLDIYNDANELLFTKTVILKVVSAITSGSYTILPIGDSMTYGGTQWQIEVQKNLSNGSMTYVGTQEHDGRGDMYYHEGYNGNTAYGFLNNATLRGITNPFYNPDTSKFDWNYYKNTYSINPDIIQIELGTNDINGYTVDVAVENIAEMVDLIRKDDASIPICICNAIYRSNQNGIAHQLNTQGYSIGNGVYKYGEDVKIQNLMIGLENRLADYKNVYYIPLALCHDSENNFGKKTIPLNSRSQETIVIPADSIHPNKTGEDSSTYGYNIVGYLQFADVMYSTLCGVLPTLN